MLLSWVRSSLVDSRDAIVVQRCLGSWEESGGMGMGNLDGFGGRTPSSFVNPSSSTRSSWRCVLLRRHQKPGRVGLCHQTGRIRKSLVSVRRPRQIPTQNGDRGRGPRPTGVSSHPSGLGVLESHRFGFWTTPSLARRFVTGPHPTAPLNSAPPFSLGPPVVSLC